MSFKDLPQNKDISETNGDRVFKKNPKYDCSTTKYPKTTHSQNEMNVNICFGKGQPRFAPERHQDHKRTPNQKMKNYKFQKKKREAVEFRYGNYHQYYGFRNAGEMDSRMTCMKQEWFVGKDILDIGCNAGHFTLAIARDLSPRSVLGVDIDLELIHMAKVNVRHYIEDDHVRHDDFPLSLAMNYGPVATALDPRSRYPDGIFPFNIQFVQSNYILPCDDLIEEQKPHFDTVLCLSVTKWVHLNWGDSGIHRLFRRIYSHLRPGGQLLLEAQAYGSYAKKKRITEEIFQHYSKIQLFPEMFNEYLLKQIGFKSCELVDTPAHSSQGFSRPIYLFTKGGPVQSTVKQPKHVVYHYSSESHDEDSDVGLLSD